MTRAPDLTQKVIGYRSWRAVDPYLCPTVTGPRWEPGPNRATCSPTVALPALGEVHDAPAERCLCGLYAHHELSEDAGMTGLSVRVMGVTGAISAWGRIQVHASGFRAEYAEVVALLVPDPVWSPLPERDRERIMRIAELYGVPTLSDVESLRAYAGWHGSPVPESLRPEPEPEAEPMGGAYARGGHVAPPMLLPRVAQALAFQQSLLHHHAASSAPSGFTERVLLAKQQRKRKRHVKQTAIHAAFLVLAIAWFALLAVTDQDPIAHGFLLGLAGGFAGLNLGGLLVEARMAFKLSRSCRSLERVTVGAD